MLTLNENNSQFSQTGGQAWLPQEGVPHQDLHGKIVVTRQDPGVQELESTLSFNFHSYISEEVGANEFLMA